ncbi:MAG TPA: hypothetical protein VJH05_01680 [Candidatus Paceibacterota bacterium]
MNEALAKFKETLNSGKTIAIRTGNTTDITKILASHILHSAFLSLEKQSSVECGTLDESTQNFLSVLFGEKHKKSEALEQTLIKIDTAQIPISELKYEKEGTILKIILTSPENFDSKKISVEKEKIPADLLLLVDPEEKQLEKILADTPHKEVIKITSKDKDISIKIFEIISALEKDLLKNMKEALWILLDSGSEFSRERILAKKEILEINPDVSKIAASKEALKTKWFWKLLGRVLQRSEIEKDLGTIWTFITPEDFAKTNQNESAILPLFKEIKKLRRGENFLAILWNDGKENIKAIVGGENNLKLKSLATQMNSALSSSYFFAEGFKNFSEAETKIRSEIKKVLQ